MRTLFILLLLCATSFAGIQDRHSAIIAAKNAGGGGAPSPIARYNFESGALTTDSAGTNTLTNNNSATADAVNFKEGSASTFIVDSSSQYYSISDTSLSSNFPLKSGTSNTSFTFCFWIRDSKVGSDSQILTKYNIGSGLRSFRIELLADNTFRLTQGYNSGASFEYSSVTAATTDDQWYHVGVTYNDTTKAYKIRVWDDTNTTNFTNITGNFTNNVSLTTASWLIGARDEGGSISIDANIDKLEFFNSVLSDAEIDARR